MRTFCSFSWRCVGLYPQTDALSSTGGQNTMWDINLSEFHPKPQTRLLDLVDYTTAMYPLPCSLITDHLSRRHRATVLNRKLSATATSGAHDALPLMVRCHSARAFKMRAR